MSFEMTRQVAFIQCLETTLREGTAEGPENGILYRLWNRFYNPGAKSTIFGAAWLGLGNHNKSLRLPSLSSIYWRSIALDSPNFCHLCSAVTKSLNFKI